MRVSADTLRRGLRNGLRTTWILGKVIFPITALVTMISFTPIIDGIVRLCQPLMKWMGLPGEAAIPLVLGNLLNLYAAIGAILSLELTVKEVFILAVMVSFSHSLPVETAIARQIGVNPWVMIGVRLGLAVLSALTLHHLWDGGQSPAQYGWVPENAKADPEGFGAILWHGLSTALAGVLQMAAVVIPLMIGIELLKDLDILRLLSRWLAPVTGLIGVHRNSVMTLLAGLLFGISFGAGVIIQSARENQLGKRDLYLLAIFLVACHAVIEDTLIFVPLGIPVWPLLLIRVTVAFAVTALAARLLNRIMKPVIQEGNMHEI